MIRLLVAADIVVAAVAVAALLSRRRPVHDPLGPFPSWVDVTTLGLAAGGMVVYTDPGCAGCAQVVSAVVASGRDHVVITADDPRRPTTIRHFPTTLDVGPDGVVRRGWVGPLPAGAFDL